LQTVAYDVMWDVKALVRYALHCLSCVYIAYYVTALQFCNLCYFWQLFNKCYLTSICARSILFHTPHSISKLLSA